MYNARILNAQVVTNNGASIKTTSGAIVYVAGSVNNATGTYDNTGTTTITGNCTNGGTIGDSGTINLAGDWINNNIFTRYIGTVVMNGTVQNFSGTQVTTFNNLTILGGSTKTCNIAEIVDGQMDFTSGVVYTTQSNLLTFTVNGTWINGSSTSYVNGPCGKDFNSVTEFRYPIGKAARFNTAGVKPNSTTATTFRAEYFNTAYANTTSVIAPVTNVSKFQYWNIDRTSGTSNAQVRLYWISGDYSLPSYIVNINNLLVGRWTGAAWTSEGRSSVTGTYVSGNILSNVCSTWGLLPNEHFTICSDSSVNPLPVELDHFAAKQEGSHVRLEWLTRSEVQNLGFEIERHASTESPVLIQSWQTDPSLQAKSHYGADYASLDDPKTDGLYTYDLYQRDVDGARWHIASQTLLYRQTPDGTQLAIDLYPNPVVDHTQLRIGLEQDVANVQVEIYDLAGRKIFDESAGAMTSGFHNYSITGLERFSTGRYTVVVNTGDRRLTKSLIIQQ
jgi:hypothetical protein